MGNVRYAVVFIMYTYYNMHHSGEIPAVQKADTWLGGFALQASIRADSRFASSQWETALLRNDVSHWLGAQRRIGPEYDKVMTWKHFMHYWPFVKGIHRWQVVSPHQGAVIQRFGVFFVASLNNLLNKKSTSQWFEMPWWFNMWEK